MATACGGAAPPTVTPAVLPPSLPTAVVGLAPARWPVASQVWRRGADGELVAVGTPLTGNAELPDLTGGPWLLGPAGPLAAAEEAAFLRAAADAGASGLAFPSMTVRASLLAALAAQPGLIALALPETTFDAAAVAAWPLLPMLTSLDLARAALPAGAIATIVSRTPALDALVVTDVRLDDTAAKVIAGLLALRALGASGTSLSDASAATICASSTLEIVALARTRAGRLTSVALASAPRRELHLDDTAFDDTAVATMAVLAVRLEGLTLSRTRVGDRGLGWLPRATSLRQLELADTNVSDTLIRKLALPLLAEIDLGGRPIEARTLVAMAAAATALQVVVIGPNRRVDDAVLAALAKHPGLRVLGLGQTSVTGAGLPALVGTPELVELDLHDTIVRVLGAGLDCGLANAVRRARLIGFDCVVGHGSHQDATTPSAR